MDCRINLWNGTPRSGIKSIARVTNINHNVNRSYCHFKAIKSPREAAILLDPVGVFSLPKLYRYTFYFYRSHCHLTLCTCLDVTRPTKLT